MFFRNFAKAFVRVSEFGQEANMLSEFDGQQVEGGYQEPSRLNAAVKYLRTAYSAHMTDQPQQEWLEAEEELKQIEQK